MIDQIDQQYEDHEQHLRAEKAMVFRLQSKRLEQHTDS